MPLDCFYALTENTLYLVSTEKDWTQTPTVKSIGTNAVGVCIGYHLQGGTIVGIAGLSGIVLYNPVSPEDRELKRLRISVRGNNTTAIVGLFLDEQVAQKCLNAGKLQPNDPRFREESTRVIEAIGPDHLVFVVSSLHYPLE